MFTWLTRDTGHLCVRAEGHEGLHRWSARWQTVAPAEVEAEIARDLDTWERSEDEPDEPRE